MLKYPIGYYQNVAASDYKPVPPTNTLDPNNLGYNINSPLTNNNRTVTGQGGGYPLPAVTSVRSINAVSADGTYTYGLTYDGNNTTYALEFGVGNASASVNSYIAADANSFGWSKDDAGVYGAAKSIVVKLVISSGGTVRTLCYSVNGGSTFSTPVTLTMTGPLYAFITIGAEPGNVTYNPLTWP
jgi:hypothetical protein